MSPCKDCTDRILGCHGSCERYLEFKEENIRISRERMKASQRFSGRAEGIERMRKYKSTNSVIKCHKK